MQSHPSWVRGLKLWLTDGDTLNFLSHPSWVRGLKRHRPNSLRVADRVAPLVGAWIETKNGHLMITQSSTSHPSWVRGLKPVIVENDEQSLGRTPRGCVD